MSIRIKIRIKIRIRSELTCRSWPKAVDGYRLMNVLRLGFGLAGNVQHDDRADRIGSRTRQADDQSRLLSGNVEPSFRVDQQVAAGRLIVKPYIDRTVVTVHGIFERATD